MTDRPLTQRIDAALKEVAAAEHDLYARLPDHPDARHAALRLGPPLHAAAHALARAVRALENV